MKIGNVTVLELSLILHEGELWVEDPSEEEIEIFRSSAEEWLTENEQCYLSISVQMGIPDQRGFYLAGESEGHRYRPSDSFMQEYLMELLSGAAKAGRVAVLAHRAALAEV